jgi:hypothetical protein
MYLLGAQRKFSICGLEVLGLDTEPDPLQMGFFVGFLNSIFSKLGFLCPIPGKIVFALVSDRVQPALNSEVPGSSPIPRVQIFPPEYLGTNAI